MTPTLLTVPALVEQWWNDRVLQDPIVTPVWRLWTYAQPAVVLGLAQRGMRLPVRPDAVLPVMVRCSGGGAVLVGPWMLSMSVALPVEHPLVSDGVVASYAWLGRGIAQALEGLGVRAQVLSPEQLHARRAGQPVPTLDWACFGGVSPWEVLAHERKLVGLAQIRRRNGVLLTAGILLRSCPWETLCERLGRPGSDAARLRQCTISCEEFVDTALQTQALVRSLHAMLGMECAPSDQGARVPG
ncbi:MAG: ligase [Proteobacteria bacterium]|nr:ligase [Pseudomonadota bacterium]